MIVDLYNLYLGHQAPPDHQRKQIIGPFEVELVDDYEHAVKSIYQPARLHVSMEWNRVDPQPPGLDSSVQSGQFQSSTRVVEEVKGDWVVTAKATLRSNGAQSILGSEPMGDSGIWDLCELLTFVTGRRVLTQDMLDRFNPNRANDPACSLAESLAAADLAWRNRQSLVDLGVVYALLCHNISGEFAHIQVLAAQCNTALNVLVDKWKLPNLAKIAKHLRESLAIAVEKAVHAHEELPTEVKDRYVPILRSKVMEGPYSMLDRLFQFLANLDLIPITSGPETVRRVRYLNTVRNRLTHAGEMPLLKNMTQEQSDQYTVSIVSGVLMAINQMALGKMLGFTANGLGSVSQHPEALRRFFRDGVWNNHNIETQSIEDWLDDPLGLS